MLNAGADGARRCRCSCRPASSMRSGLQHVTQFCNSTYTTLEDDIILGIANHLNVLPEHSVTQLFWEYNNKTENDSCSLQARALKFIKLFENVSLKAIFYNLQNKHLLFYILSRFHSIQYLTFWTYVAKYKRLLCTKKKEKGTMQYIVNEPSSLIFSLINLLMAKYTNENEALKIDKEPYKIKLRRLRIQTTNTYMASFLFVMQ